MPRRRKPSKEVIHSANSILAEMSESGKKVQVLVVWPLFMVRFQATPKRRKGESWYTLSAEGFDLHIVPEMSETILFSQEGGLFLSRKGMSMTVEPEEHSTEELLSRYPGSGNLIH